MENLAGLVVRLLTIRAEFGDAAFEHASHAASIAIARNILELAEQRAAEAIRPPCIVIPLTIVTRADEEAQ